MQTEPYLEEILDKPIVSEQVCQTDLFLERPITPPFVPVKYGIDIATEILPGDLFNFDIEVEPIIQNFVSKIMTVALLEIAQENEIQEITVNFHFLFVVAEKNYAFLMQLFFCSYSL